MSVRVDAVVVAYRSAATLRECVVSLLAMPGVRVTVVDNASPDDCLATVSDLPIEIVRSSRNGGFSFGCNLGAAGATAPYLLFVNPDARLHASALDALVEHLEAHPSAGLVGPRIVESDGALAYSQRRFPRRRSTFAQAIFLHRLRPHAAWSDEVVRDEGAYAGPGSPEWVSGACVLVRREAFEAVGGWDEDFFLYCEDTDLCRRLWSAGWQVRYEPAAVISHVGGASSEEGQTRAIAASSRITYARKHSAGRAPLIEAAGVALGEATHAVTAVRRPSSRRGHLAALRAAVVAASSHRT